jgi:hypothetical protein
VRCASPYLVHIRAPVPNPTPTPTTIPPPHPHPPRRPRFVAVPPFAPFSTVPLQFVPQLAAAVRDSNAHVKLAAERAMMHALQVHTNPDVLAVRGA